MASSTRSPAHVRQPLAEALAALAETPDDVPGITGDLQKVARLAADRVTAADYAAIVRRPDDGSCLVAVGGELAEAVDRMEPPDTADRHDDDTDIGLSTDTMIWPGFRETAAGLGLGAVSVPLFTGSGATVASLDLYTRDAGRLAPLAAGIGAAYDPDLPWPGEPGGMPALDPGGAELVAGFSEALSVRQTIQFALVLLGASEQSDTARAYLRLRMRAADEGVSLLTAATAVIAPSFREPGGGGPDGRSRPAG